MIPDQKPLFQFTHQLRSRYSETDKMGYVYYGHFLQFFEVARTELVRSLGVSYKKMEDDGFMLPVIHSEIRYKNPVFYDELMDIEVLVFKKPHVRLETFYRVTTKEKSVINTLGSVTLVFMNAETRRPVKGPDYFINAVSL
jgi:acyl-CoA thioester hydrolase